MFPLEFHNGINPMVLSQNYSDTVYKLSSITKLFDVSVKFIDVTF